MGEVVLSDLDNELLATVPGESKDEVKTQLQEYNRIKNTLMETGLHIAIKNAIDENNQPCLDIFYFDSYDGKEGKSVTSTELSLVRLGKNVNIKEVGAYLIDRLSRQLSKGRLPSQAYDVPNLFKDGVLYITKEDFEAFQKGEGTDAVKGLAALLK